MTATFQPLRFINDNPDYHAQIESAANANGFTCTAEQKREIAGLLIEAGIKIARCNEAELWNAMRKFAGVQS